MRYFLMILFIFSFGFAGEFTVPIGVSGNRLVLTVSNPERRILYHVRVTLTESPDWLIPESKHAVVIDSLEAKSCGDACFLFAVDKGEAGRTGTVILAVTDAKGESLGSREFRLITSLEQSCLTLSPCYPNPANPGTTIQFALPEPGRVRLDVINVLGQKVRTLMNQEKQAGLYDVIWDGRNDLGTAAATGAYIIRLITEVKGKTARKTTKLLLSK